MTIAQRIRDLHQKLTQRGDEFGREAYRAVMDIATCRATTDELVEAAQVVSELYEVSRSVDRAVERFLRSLPPSQADWRGSSIGAKSAIYQAAPSMVSRLEDALLAQFNRLDLGLGNWVEIATKVPQGPIHNLALERMLTVPSSAITAAIILDGPAFLPTDVQYLLELLIAAAG